VRSETYLAFHRLTGSRLPHYYRQYLRDDRERRYPDQVELLGRVLRHAVGTVPYYREVAGDGPEAVDDPEAFLKRFPVLTKETIRREFDRLKSTSGDCTHWYENSTGGSTGEPITLIQDAEHRARIVAIQEVYSTWAGGGLGRPQLYIWGSERDIMLGHETLRNRFANRLLNRRMLNAFRLDRDEMREFLEVARRGPPKLVVAYSQAGFEVARFAAEEHITVPRQLGVIATAGMLYDDMRTQIEQTFGCRVFSRYGSREIGDIAGECEHGTGLHILPWCSYVEVLDANGAPAPPGVEGDLVLTGLTNDAMPLLRYQIGDRGVRAADEPCPCGRPGPRLARLTGRTVDTFLTPTGAYVAGGYFVQLVSPKPWVERFQILQRSPTEVEYLLVVRGEERAGDRDEIVRGTRDALGDECNVSFRVVDDIEASASGKRHYTRRLF